MTSCDRLFLTLMTACQIIAVESYHRNPIMTGHAPMSGLLTASQAAKLVNKSPSTIRRLIKLGKIPSTVSAEGWKVVTKTDLMLCFHERLQEPVKKDAAQPSQSSDSLSQDVMNALKTALDAANRTIEHERSLVKSYREENRELQGKLIQITHEMKAMLEDKPGGIISRWIRS